MKRGHACLLLIASGCNSAFGLEPTVTRFDARPIDAPGCADGVFGSPTVVTSFDNGLRDFEPALRHDLLEVWAHQVATVDEIWRATRTDVTEPFGAPVKASFSSATDDGRPTLSGDGLRMLFLSDRAGGNDVWEVTRSSLGEDFGSPRAVVGFADHNLLSLDVTFDGLTLYFKDSSQIDDAVYTATRATLDAPFIVSPAIVALGASSPAISPDDLELFYNTPGTNQLWKVVRASPTEPFTSPPVLVLEDGEDPDLAADGRTLVTTRNSSLVIHQRSCP
ncbi:MAG: hypothetical protein M3619_05065 [Myxococcota bacterium]|nr:hypothetical protein [Myxococcota bacterium]